MTVLWVQWIDTATTWGWREGYKDTAPEPVETVGFLLSETDKFIRLAMSTGEGNMFSEVTCIPRVNIVKRRKLK